MDLLPWVASFDTCIIDMAYSKKEIEDIFVKVLIEISDGKALRNVLKNKAYPSTQTFYKWLDEDEKKSKRYARACESRADAMIEDMVDIADNQEYDVYTNDDGIEVTNHNVIQRAKLRVDTRKWIASKLKPKKYGESSLIKFADNEGDKLKVNAIFNIDLLHVPNNDGDK